MRYITLGWLALFLAADAGECGVAGGQQRSLRHLQRPERSSDPGLFATRLERFDAAMSHVFVKPQAKPGPSNRVTIFVVSSTRQSPQSRRHPEPLPRRPILPPRRSARSR